MKSISYENLDKNEWSKFVFDHPDGNIFQTPEMHEVYEKTKKFKPLFIGVVDNSGDILGLLISVIQKEWGGIMAGLTSRCITWGCPVIKHDLSENEKINILNFILKEQNKIVKNEAIYMEFRNLFDTTKLKPIFEQNNYNYEDELNIIIDLTKREETIWNEFHRKRRTGIRKAEKEGLTTVFTNKPNVIKKMYNIYLDTYKHAKHPLPDDSLFLAVNKILSKKGMMINIFAQLDDLPIGAMTILMYKKIIYAWYLGGLIEYRNKHPNDLLPWEAMKWGVKNNYEIFDFMGAGKPNEKFGIRDFKLKFGGTVVNYGRYKNVFKKAKMKIALTGLKIMKAVR